MVTPAPQMVVQPPMILPATAEAPNAVQPIGAPVGPEGMQPQQDMTMAQWMYGHTQPMQMMVPVQMVYQGMGAPIIVPTEGNQTPLPPGAPCMWVPSLGTSAKPDKNSAQRVVRPKLAKHVPTRAGTEPRDYVAEMVKNARARPVVARPVIGKRPGAAQQPRAAKGINMKWRTRYVL